MEENKHSLNAKINKDAYVEYQQIVAIEISSINKFTDKVIKEYNDSWKKNNPDKAKILKQKIKELKQNALT